MIKVDIGGEPEYLQSKTVDLAIEKLEEFYIAKDRKQKRYNFPFNKEIDSYLKPILFERFYGKCGYCETKIQSPIDGIVDRFRPYNGVRDKKEYFEDLYWWLVYEWDNLVFSCKECSQFKANYFPILSNRATSKDSSLDEEMPLLLNPCSDDVEEHLKYQEGFLYGTTTEGEQTIELLNLNRTSLVSLRKRVISEIGLIINRLEIRGIAHISNLEINYLNDIFDKRPDIEFVFIKYEYLLEALDFNPTLRGFIGSKSNVYQKYKEHKAKKIVKINDTEIVKSDFFPIEYIEINNFKNISSIRIDFPIDQLEQHAWITLLGENGLGKSSILQAICIGLYPNLKNGDEIVSKLIHNGQQQASIIIKQRDSNNTLITKLERDGNLITHEGFFFSSLIGYGAVRLLPNKKLKSENTKNQVRYNNLFDSSIPIGDILPWISFIYDNNKPLFDRIAYSIKKLLPEEIDENLVIENDELVFEKSRKSFNSLSDGYKNTISLALDIMKTLSGENTDMDKLSGIVLIDELGNQLHPRWQMQVVSQLRSVFPKINFIISTHHPLCLRGMKENEVMVLHKDENNETFIVKDLPDPSTLRVDQILTSPFFGLHSAVDPEIEKLFNEYYSLLAKDKLSDEEENRKFELSDKIPKIKYLGDTLREELVIYVIDELLAKKNNSFNIDELRKEAKDRVKSIWESLNSETN